METTTPSVLDSPQSIQESSAPRVPTKAELQRKKFFQEARERSGYEHQWFLDRRYSKTPLVFQSTEGPIKAIIDRFGVFDFNLKVPNQKDPLKLPKLNIFTISSERDQEQLSAHLKVHEPTRSKKLAPQPKASYSAPIPEGLIDKAKAEKKQIAMMLLNGTIAIGIPMEESPYSILLKVPDIKGKVLFVFKHGLTGVRLYEELQPLI